MKSGFVSVVGRANVGKSTLMEKILGEKISIISNKAQTTRDEIQIIYNDDESQIVFLDTPGIQKPKNKLQDHLLKVSQDSFSQSDVLVFVIDNSLTIGRLDKYIIEQIKKINIPKILLINKVDLLNHEQLLDLKIVYDSFKIFDEILAISALNNERIDSFIETVKRYLPEGPKYYPDDMITNKSERFIVSEIIREKALRKLGEEVPHGIYVRIDSYKKRDEHNLIDIYATIIVEKESHKEIVIGKSGNKIKQIGTDARKEIEKFLRIRVNLKLWVSVKKNWRKDKKMVERFGYK
ncbi:MAG: GTPase Era [Peptoniphilaceae bacterium]|nr:GTPase Era [Peptoniphilaceae bacterium]MDD7383519.1 GTPase Era [Peptoniphilaceae bacterium]MDY3738692.1 GTPase Era [Peptoniphilaceae bacterium]